MTAFPDSWNEFCLIGIQIKGGSEVQFGGFTEEISALDWGEKDIETKPLVNGGHVVRKVPMTTEGITMKVYPIKADQTADGVVQFFHKPSAVDSSQPIVADNTLDRYTFRVILLWTAQLPSGPASAETQPTAGFPAYRIQILNAYMTMYKPSFDDKELSAEVTFKWAPFQKDGTRNKLEESTDGTSQLAAAESFT